MPTTPTFRASGSWTVNTTSPLSATLPTHASGDLLICEVHSSSSGTTISTHGVSGWTLIGSMASTSGTRRGRVSVYALKATSSSMTNPSATFSSTGTSYQNAVRAHSITTGTWNDTGTLSQAWEDVTTAEASNSSTLAFSGLVTTDVNRRCIASVRQCDDTATGITWSNSYETQGTNLDSSTGSDGFSSTGHREQLTAGSADTTATFTSGGSVSTMGVEFALLPGPATYGDSLTETPTTAETLADAATWPNSFTETATSTDGVIGGLLFSDPLTETASSTDTISPAWTARDSLTETATSQDEVETEDSIYVSAFTESASATDGLGTAATWPNSVTETATAADGLADVGTWPNALTETAVSADGLADELIGAPSVYDDAITEAATADDALADTVGVAEEGAAGPFPWWWPDGYRLRKKAPKLPVQEPEELPPPPRQPQVYAVEVYALAYASDSVAARAGWGASLEELCLAVDAVSELHTPRRRTARFLQDERDMADLIALWARRSPIVHRLGETRGK